MSTSPFDDPKPFVLLPMRETAWQKLIRLAFRVFNRGGHEQRGIDRVAKSQSALNVGPQIGGNNLSGSNYAANQGGVGRAQGNSYQTVDVAQSGSLLKIYEGGVDAINYGHSGVFAQGLGIVGGLAHDGSYNFYKWDNAAGCMVPYEPSTPSRFRRAFGAFMREWRRK